MDLRKKITLSGKEGKTQVQDMEVVYRQHAQTVFKYLMLLTHEANLAEELTQETFYQLQDHDVAVCHCKKSVFFLYEKTCADAS